MRPTRRDAILATLVVLLMTVGAGMVDTIASAIEGGRYGDVTHHPHRGEVEALADLGIVRAEGEFRPDDPITRAETAALLCRALDDCDPTLAPEPAPTTTVPALPWDGLTGRDAHEAMIRHYFDEEHWPWAFRVVACESVWDPTARNGRSGASGLFQHIPRYWAERSAAAGWEGADIFDPEANVAVAAWLHNGGRGAHHWVCR